MSESTGRAPRVFLARHGRHPMCFHTLYHNSTSTKTKHASGYPPHSYILLPVSILIIDFRCLTTPLKQARQNGPSRASTPASVTFPSRHSASAKSALRQQCSSDAASCLIHAALRVSTSVRGGGLCGHLSYCLVNMKAGIWSRLRRQMPRVSLKERPGR
jgi:hypothetical protein